MISLGCLCLKPASFEIFGCNYVCIYVYTSPRLPRFQVRPSKSRLFRSQSIDLERKQKNIQNTNWVWCGKLKTESTRKLSNFYFQWGKTLYQNNLTNIAFFFTFFKGLRCNNKSSVVTPKKIFHGRQRKLMSNFTRYVISIGNSMICSDINNWHKYHEWYISKLLYFISRAVRQVKFETILKYHSWYLCQISHTNHAIICLYYYPQKVCNFHI